MPLIVLDEEMLAAAAEGFDDLLSVAVAGKNCLLTMQPVAKPCVNCVYDPIGKKSSNKWLSGGPIEFHNGNCPACGGSGKRFEEITNSIVMTIDIAPKTFLGFPTNIRLPAGSIVTRGFITDMPLVKKAIQMRILSNVPLYDRYTYTLAGECVDPFQFIKGRYFAALWTRAGTIGVA